MKKLLFAIGAMAMLVACGQEQAAMTINGTAKGFDDETMVYINSADINNPGRLVRIDSTTIVDGKFTFTGEVNEIDMKYFEFGNEDRYYLPFIYENGQMSVFFDKNNDEDNKVSGTVSNDAFIKYKKQAKPIEEKMKSFQEKNKEKMQNARLAQDEETINELITELSEIADELTETTKTFAKNNKNFATLMLLGQLHQSQQITDEELIDIYNELDESLKTTKIGKEIQFIIDKAGNLLIGMPAPDFSGPTPEGGETSLKDNLGKVTIVDFWAAWCGPCRKENPNVVRIYNKYKEQGLSIIGVSLDRDKEMWVKAIEDDQLTWPQISNLAYFNDPIAQEYNISAIPATFILDAEGNIAAKNLRGQELEDKVAELLAK